MAARKKADSSPIALRIARYFDASFRHNEVAEIENQLTAIAEVSRIYQVSKTPCIVG